MLGAEAVHAAIDAAPRDPSKGLRGDFRVHVRLRFMLGFVSKLLKGTLTLADRGDDTGER